MIWFSPLNLNDLNKRSNQTAAEYLGIEFIEIGDDFLLASMPVDKRTKQPAGILHGGASCLLAETVGSTAGNCIVDYNQYICVGLDINANHVRQVSSGMVFAKASPLHLGRKTQVWHIDICNEEHKRVCVSRLTMAVLERNMSK